MIGDRYAVEIVAECGPIRPPYVLSTHWTAFTAGLMARYMRRRIRREMRKNPTAVPRTVHVVRRSR